MLISGIACSHPKTIEISPETSIPNKLMSVLIDPNTEYNQLTVKIDHDLYVIQKGKIINKINLNTETDVVDIILTILLTMFITMFIVLCVYENSKNKSSNQV